MTNLITVPFRNNAYRDFMPKLFQEFPIVSRIDHIETAANVATRALTKTSKYHDFTSIVTCNYSKIDTYGRSVTCKLFAFQRMEFWLKVHRSFRSHVIRAGGSHAYRRDLHVAIDVEPVVLAGEHHRPVVHERHIEALRMLNFALQSRYQLSVLRKDRQVKVVVIVRNQNLAGRVDANTDRVVSHTLASDLT